jgi:transposase
MDRRRHTREFKVEAVKLVRERGVAVKQAARDLNVHPNVLHRWTKDFAADPQRAFPGKGQMKPEQLPLDAMPSAEYPLSQ